MTTEIVEYAGKSFPYHKILGPFTRNVEKGSKDYNKLMWNTWTRPEFEYLAGLKWVWTEKVDGTNVRVGWDGVDVSYAGRTDKAQLPPKLLTWLEENLPANLLEQQFEGTPAILYGEGYGGKIQKGGNYRPDESFILFDIRIGRWWLQREDVVEIGGKLGVDVVPEIIDRTTVWGAIDAVNLGVLSEVSQTPGFVAEGVVGTPLIPLFNRAGERAVMKVKTKDFAELSKLR